MKNVYPFGLVADQNELWPKVVSGKANMRGFILTFQNKKTFCTSSFEQSELQFSEKEKILLRTANRYLLSSISIGIVFAIFSKSPLFAVPIFLLGITLGIGFYFYHLKDSIEWHALEHKSATLLEANIPVNLENLKKMTSINIACGSNLPPLFFLFISSLWILFMLPPGEHQWVRELSGIMLISSFLYLASLITKIGLNNILFWFTGAPILAPAAALSFLYQKLFLIKEPSEEKYEQAVKELREYQFFS